MNASIRYGWLVVAAAVLAGCTTMSKDQQLANRGMEHIQNGKYKKAERTLNKALDKNPDNPYAVLNMGVVYHNTGRLQKARRMYKKVIEMQPTRAAERASREGKQGKSLTDLARENLKALRSQRKGSGGSGSGGNATG